jgi:N-acyl-D-aspartate/D-glutamate deacylase
MADYDLVIRNGTVATAADTIECDVGVRDGLVATLGAACLQQRGCRDPARSSARDQDPAG